jgi:hypothetical protein
MGWHTRFTRFGDVHMVFSQEGDNACGIACVRMVLYKVNKLSWGKSALTSEHALYNVYGNVSGVAYDGSAYTYANHLATVLTRLTANNWMSEQLTATEVSQKLVDMVAVDVVGGSLINTLTRGDPMILLVGWNNSCAHFVVVDTINRLPLGKQLYASVCDPWDGDVHITPLAVAQPFTYLAQNQTFDEPGSRTAAPGAAPRTRWERAKEIVTQGKSSFSIGSPEHSYADVAMGGTANGWVIRRA